MLNRLKKQQIDELNVPKKIIQHSKEIGGTHFGFTFYVKTSDACTVIRERVFTQLIRKMKERQGKTPLFGVTVLENPLTILMPSSRSQHKGPNRNTLQS